jgi:branched-chain amino acid transport system substrate-binding protein
LTTAGAGTTATEAHDGKSIVVGMICSCSGPQASSLSSTSKVAEAWASSVNATGGINGHPVKMIVKDDGQNPAQGLQVAKELVTQDHVMAIVGEVSQVDGSWASYVASAGVPVVGGISPESPFASNPDFFPSGTQIEVMVAGVLALAKGEGAHHVGVLYCAESPVCAQINPLAKGVAVLDGLGYSAGSISAAAPNYLAPCLAQRSDGVDAQFIADSNPTVQRVVASCAEQGYKPKVINLISTLDRSWFTDPNMANAELSGTNANAFDTSTPAIAEFHSTLNKYAPGLVSSSQFLPADIWPWAGGKLFEAAAKAAHITPSSTGADVKKGLYALKNETLGGLAPPLNFTPGKPAFIPCYFSVTLSGGNPRSLNGNKPTCLTATQSAGLAKVVSGK